MKPIKNSNIIEYTDLSYPFLNPKDPNTGLFKFNIYQDGARWNTKRFRPDFPDQSSWRAFFDRVLGE